MNRDLLHPRILYHLSLTDIFASLSTTPIFFLKKEKVVRREAVARKGSGSVSVGCTD